MFIRRMNRVFASHGRYLFGLLTIVIIISFVGFFTPGFNSMFTGDGRKTSIGEVFGEQITTVKLAQYTDYAVIISSLQFNISNLNNPSLRSMARKNAFRVLRMVMAGEKLGVCVSAKEIAKYIRELPAFQTDKKFDVDKFNNYVKDTLIPAGFDKEDLDESVRCNLIMTGIYGDVTDPVITTPDEIKEFFYDQYEDFDVERISCKAEDFVSKVKVKKAELEAFFQSRSEDYQIEPEYSAEVAVFSYDNYKKAAEEDISEEDITQYFDEKTDDFIVEEKKTWQKRIGEDFEKAFKYEEAENPRINYHMVKKYIKDHKYDKYHSQGQISLETKNKIKDKLIKEYATKAAGDDAYNFADTLYKQIVAEEGKDSQLLRELAKKAENAVIKSTGWIKADTKKIAGIGEEPKLSTAVAAIYREPSISDPVSGENAAFVALLIEKKERRNAELAQIKAKVTEDFKKEKSLNLAREKVRSLRLEVTDALKAKKKFPKIKADIDKEVVTVKKLKTFSTSRPPSEKDGSLIGKLAAETEIGEVSSIENTKTGAFFVYVSKRTLPSDKDFEKKKNSVAMMYEAQKKNAAWSFFEQWVEKNTSTSVKELEEKR